MLTGLTLLTLTPQFLGLQSDQHIPISLAEETEIDPQIVAVIALWLLHFLA